MKQLEVLSPVFNLKNKSKERNISRGEEDSPNNSLSFKAKNQVKFKISGVKTSKNMSPE